MICVEDSWILTARNRSGVSYFPNGLSCLASHQDRFALFREKNRCLLIELVLFSQLTLWTLGFQCTEWMLPNLWKERKVTKNSHVLTHFCRLPTWHKREAIASKHQCVDDVWQRKKYTDKQNRNPIGEVSQFAPNSRRNNRQRTFNLDDPILKRYINAAESIHHTYCSDCEVLANG